MDQVDPHAIAADAERALERPGPQDASIVAFIEEYLRLWNAGDAAAIGRRIYRIPGETEPEAIARFEKSFSDLRAEGYSHSTTAGIDGRRLSPTTGVAVMRFTRRNTDGSILGPAERRSTYYLQVFPDGWRIVGRTAPGGAQQSR